MTLGRNDVGEALAQATCDKFANGGFVGKMLLKVALKVALGATLRECQDARRAVVEDWLEFGYSIPTLAVTDLRHVSA